MHANSPTVAMQAKPLSAFLDAGMNALLPHAEALGVRIIVLHLGELLHQLPVLAIFRHGRKLVDTPGYLLDDCLPRC